MRSKFSFALTFLLLVSCKQEPKTNYVSLDLLGHGIPITIMAPPEPDVKVTDLTVMKDLTIKKDANYYIQLYASSTNITDVQQLKSERLSEIKKNPFFSKIVSDKPNGFIYEKIVDSIPSYAFNYVYLQGDQEYIFQTGLTSLFKLEDVQNMYNAVKQGEKK